MISLQVIERTNAEQSASMSRQECRGDGVAVLKTLIEVEVNSC